MFSTVEFQTCFATFTTGLEAKGVLVVGPRVCPHRFAEPRPCEKPNVLLNKRAASAHQLTATDWNVQRTRKRKH